MGDGVAGSAVDGARAGVPGRDAVPAPDGSAEQRGGFGRLVLLVLVTAVVLAIVRAVVVQSFVIPSESMQPTLDVGDRVLVYRSAYRFGEVGRGDVIVFDGSGLFTPATPPPGSELAEAGRALARVLGMPVDAHAFVKRVVGLPGERVACCDDEGRLTINGVALDEPYVEPGDVPSKLRFDVVVPTGRLWVMGDNRSASADSRAHMGDPGGGTVPLGRIVGRAVAVYWPLERAGSLRAPTPEENS